MLSNDTPDGDGPRRRRLAELQPDFNRRTLLTLKSNHDQNVASLKQVCSADLGELEIIKAELWL